MQEWKQHGGRRHSCFVLETPPLVSFFDPDLTRSQFSASLCSEHTYSDHSWGCLPQLGTKHRGEGILRMEDARSSEENTDSQDFNIPIDHSYLAQNCLIKINCGNLIV